MKLIVLVDNNTYIDKYYYGEPALSFYIENENDKLLFDLGYSDIFIKNAELMNINIEEVSTIIFSHGHNDHTGGLRYIDNKLNIIAHPNTFSYRVNNNIEFGSFISKDEVINKHNFIPTTKVKEVSPNLFYLGEIPSINNFEKRESLGEITIDNTKYNDFTYDDSALVYKGTQGLYIITGCSHSGICNIIEYAKSILNENRVVSVIGGFHLFDKDNRCDQTIRYFMDNNIETIYPCHCTSFQVKSLINNYINVIEVGVGLELVFE